MREIVINMRARDFRQLKRLSDIEAGQWTAEHTLAIQPALQSFAEQHSLGIVDFAEKITDEEKKEASVLFMTDDLEFIDKVEMTAEEYGISLEHFIYSAITHAIEENHRINVLETEAEVAAVIAERDAMQEQLENIEQNGVPDFYQP